MPRGHTELGSLPKRKADFIEPMDCASVPKLIDGPGWVYEIKLDGYRAVGVKSGGANRSTNNIHTLSKPSAIFQKDRGRWRSSGSR